VQSAHLEPHADVAHVTGPLAAELRLMAGWLGLADVAVHGRGALAAAVEQELRS
jgi:hypothetical protein